MNKITQHKYIYEGEWEIYEKETDKHLRDQPQQFVVECDFPPNEWNEMECIHSEMYSLIISDSQKGIIPDYDDETEYHRGCGEYNRIL